jgi:HAE1 family hydrophobic/amphiphilic exporter-1
LTLVVVPVVYTYLDDLAAWARRKWSAAEPESTDAGRITVLPRDQHEDAV